VHISQLIMSILAGFWL